MRVLPRSYSREVSKRFTIGSHDCEAAATIVHTSREWTEGLKLAVLAVSDLDARAVFSKSTTRFELTLKANVGQLKTESPEYKQEATHR